jgi:hypothetical protein
MQQWCPTNQQPQDIQPSTHIIFTDCSQKSFKRRALVLQATETVKQPRQQQVGRLGHVCSAHCAESIGKVTTSKRTNRTILLAERPAGDS